ncbi:MAG: MopE-related protein, partial [Myxococcota bacterium]
MRDADSDGFGDGNATAPILPGTDCDDSAPGIFPGAAENDDPTACLQDSDGDGFGDANPPAGIGVGSDCDDSDGQVFPGAASNDGLSECAADRDGDGYGDVVAPTGGVAGTDCNDAESFTFPGAAPNDSPDACMRDADDDGYGSTTPGTGVTPGTDCLDSNAAAFVNSAPLDAPDQCALDADNDGYGDSTPPDGVFAGTDCDDSVATTFLDAPEITADGIDQDCNGVDQCFLDEDQDGFGTDTLVDDDNLDCDDGSTPSASLDGDCADDSELTFPGAAFAESDTACQTDADGDGFGAQSPVGSAQAGLDCDDGRADRNPSMVEAIGNGEDENCDTQEACYVDADSDGVGTSETLLIDGLDCDAASGASSSRGDCDDSLATGSACSSACPVWFSSSFTEYRVACTQPEGFNATASTGLSFSLNGARSAQDRFEIDYVVMEVDVTSQTSQTENWCAEYQSLCEAIGTRPTGCGVQFANSSSYAACSSEYNSFMPNNQLSCNPSSGIRTLAQDAGYASATNSNSFGFHVCSTSSCSDVLCETNNCQSALSYVNFGNTPAYTACRAFTPFAPRGPLNLEVLTDDVERLNFTRLEWEPPELIGSDSVESYEIFRGLSIDTLELLDTVSADEQSYEDQSTAVDVRYLYRV